MILFLNSKKIKNKQVIISNNEFQIIFMHNSIINLKTQNFQKKSQRTPKN
jgi:hypothetical protein